jgi:hypothetical protein
MDRINLTKVIAAADLGSFGGGIKPHTVNSSTLSDLCPRYHYYANHHKDQHLCTNIKSSALNITFDIGNALEHEFRKKFLETYPTNRVVGNWVVRPDIPVLNPDMVTKQWNHTLGKYEECELRLGHPDNTVEDFREVRFSALITGRVDWIYVDDNGKLTICELKTISKTKFIDEKTKKIKLTEPFPEHIVQDLSYIRLACEDPMFKKLGYEVNYTGKIFYTCKEYRNRTEDEKIQKLNPMYREFDINFSDHKEIMKDRWNAATIAVNSVKDGVVPEHRPCKTYLSGRGKTCPFMCRCFMEFS